LALVGFALAGLYGFVGFVRIIGDTSGGPPDNGGAWGVLAIALVAFGISACTYVFAFRLPDNEARQYNRTTYKALREKWERSWLCLRCGHKFEAQR